MRPDSQSQPPSRWIDRVGIFVAVGCGLHCAALTAIVLLYPAIWLNRSLRQSGLWTWLWWSEWSLLVGAWMLVTIAAGLVLLRRGRSRFLGFAVPGLVLLTLAIASPLHGSAPTVSALALVGGILVAIGHWINLRDSHRPARQASAD